MRARSAVWARLTVSRPVARGWSLSLPAQRVVGQVKKMPPPCERAEASWQQQYTAEAGPPYTLGAIREQGCAAYERAGNKKDAAGYCLDPHSGASIEPLANTFVSEDKPDHVTVGEPT